MNKALPDPPINPAKDRAAFNRAIDHYLPAQGFHSVNDDLSFEDALLEIARTTVDRSINCLKLG